MTEAWLAQAADSFWSLTNVMPPPPRDLGRVASLRLALSLVSLPKLNVAGIERWLARRQAPYRFLCQNRALCGCIVATRGHGLLFIDSEDDIDEQRFTVAHEVAHFLLDYETPRQHVLDLFGETIRPVLDGERAPTSEEWIDAVLSRMTLGVFTNMMARGAQGGIDQGSILRAEERADRLALELLAPSEAVLAHLPAHTLSPFERVSQTVELLVDVYRLPRLVARPYAAALIPQAKQPSMAEWLGL